MGHIHINFPNPTPEELKQLARYELAPSPAHERQLQKEYQHDIEREREGDVQ